jgi:DNA-binding MarR family transcriptional regulator
MTLSAGDPPAPVVGLLARELGVSQPTVTDSLRALEEKQLITRHRHITDARRVSATLTPAGALLVAEIAAGDRELIDAVSGLDRARQEALLGSTLALISRLVESGFISVARTCLTCHYHQLDGATHRCALLDIALGPADLRVNCPEHRLVVADSRTRD